ncbi:MAG: hypothetical protein AAF800_09330 [Planctomycetota bacterium]
MSVRQPDRARPRGFVWTAGLAASLWLSVAVGASAEEELSPLDEATRELTFFNFAKARDLFRDVRSDLGPAGGPAWRRATLGLAMSLHYLKPSSAGLIDEATGLYQSLIDADPGDLIAARALMKLGRIAEVRDYGGDGSDLETAAGFYRRVFEGWPEEDLADEAAVRYADTYFQDYRDPEAVGRGVAFLEPWVERRSDRPLASVMYELLGNVKAEYQRDYAGAVAAWRAADERGLAEPSVAGQLYWRLASLADRELGDIDLAERYYRKVITEAPRSGRAYAAQLALRAIQRANPGREVEIPEILMFMSDPDSEDSP